MHCYSFSSYTFLGFEFETVGVSKVQGTLIILLVISCFIFDTVIENYLVCNIGQMAKFMASSFVNDHVGYK